MTIRHEGELYTVHSVEHRTPGNKRAAMATKMRNLRTGSIIDYRFRAEVDIERAIFDEIEHEYLYSDNEGYHFMNTESYEQFHLGADVLGEAVYYLIPNTTVKLEFYEGKAIGVVLPDTMDLKVVDTEPTVQKATASAVMKAAKLETGLTIQVPPFVNTGDTVKSGYFRSALRPEGVVGRRSCLSNRRRTSRYETDSAHSCSRRNAGKSAALPRRGKRQRRFLQHSFESGHQFRIPPAAARFFPHDFQRFFLRERLAVGPIGGERIVDVHGLQDARGERNFLAFQMVGIAAAILLFMVRTDDRQNVAESFQRRANALADDRMLFHDLSLGGIQWAGLQQDEFGHGDFADIVNDSAAPQRVALFLGQSDFFRQRNGVARQPVAVALGVGIFRFDAARQHAQHGLRVFQFVRDSASAAPANARAPATLPFSPACSENRPRPASMPRMRSSALASPVMSTTGSKHVSGRALIARHTENPVRPGILTSSSTRSTGWEQASSNACSPFSTAMTR